MYNANPHRQYQTQAIKTASPEQLVTKLYDLGIAACHQGDRSKVRRVLVELVKGLDFEAGGEIAERLNAIYQYCLVDCIQNDLSGACQILSELREVWRDAVARQKAA